jgi:tRNA (guanine37-N1)-methyltransferase
VVGTVQEAFDDVAGREGTEPFVVATTARQLAGAIPAERLGDEAGKRPVLLLFGTGYGLTEDILLAADATLQPITGRGDFNHLPVRAAIAIYLDRILSDGND